MTPGRIVLAAVVALVCAFVVMEQSYGQSKPALMQGPTKVATCDVAYVFNHYVRADDLKKDFERRARDLQNQRDERKKAVDTIQSELQGLKEGSREYEQRFQEWQRLELDLITWKQFQDSLLKRDHFRLTEEMYRQILVVIEQVAKEQGFDLVIFGEPRDIKPANEDELVQQISQRKVLYASRDIDLTELVLTRVNDAYQATKPK